MCIGSVFIRVLVFDRLGYWLAFEAIGLWALFIKQQQYNCSRQLLLVMESVEHVAAVVSMWTLNCVAIFVCDRVKLVGEKMMFVPMARELSPMP